MRNCRQDKDPKGCLQQRGLVLSFQGPASVEAGKIPGRVQKGGGEREKERVKRRQEWIVFWRIQESRHWSAELRVVRIQGQPCSTLGPAAQKRNVDVLWNLRSTPGILRIDI